MKFLVILLLFAFVGKISSASAPRIVYRMDDDSAESDETDVEADDEPVGESSEEVPEWSFREIPQESRWQQQPNQVQVQQGQGHFQEQNRIQGNHNLNIHQGQRQQEQRPFFNSPIRRFRDDDSEEEDEEDDEDFNDDVVDSDISYNPPSSIARGSGGFRSIPVFSRGRSTPTGMTMSMARRPGAVSSRPMYSYNGMRMPVYNRVPTYNRVQMANGPYSRRPAYGGQQEHRYVSNPYRRVAQRPMNYPVRRVTSTMAVIPRDQGHGQYRPGMGTYNRPMAYDRAHMMPYRQTSTYGQSHNYNRQPIITGNGFMQRV